MTFQDAIVEFGFDCKVRKLSPRSIDNYQKQLRYLQNYLLEEYGIKNVEQVKTAHIKLFLAMMDDHQRKPRYINDLLKAFKTFFNYDPHSHNCTFFVLPGLYLASCRYLRYNIYNMCIQMPYMVMAA